MRTPSSALLLLLLLPATVSADVGPPRDPGQVAILRAGTAAKQLGGTLKARVVEELGRGGPAAAVKVCSAEAPALAAKIEAETGVKVGRSSTKLRNPANAGPDWVQAWLAANAGRPAAEVPPYEAVVDGKARVIRPIAVEAVCLGCHGAVEAQPPELRAELAARYPKDAATGYALGDLRGALWAEVAVGR